MPARVFVCIFLLITISTAQAQKKSRTSVFTGREGTTPVEMKDDPAFHSELENSSIKVFKVEVAPHESSSLDVHAHDYIVLSLSKSNFKIVGENRSFPLQMETGEMQVMKGGWPQRTINLADAPLQLVELEIVHEIHPEHAMCGLSAAECRDGEFGGDANGDFTDSTLFETDSIKLSRIDLGPNGTLPKQNYVQSHVLVALAYMKLSDQQTDKDPRELQLKAGEVTWYEGAVELKLANLGDQNAPIITVEFKE